MSIVRVWKESKGSKISWTIWDRGDEIWELKGDTLRHFEVIERSSVNNVITELLRPLRESAIPLEAIRHSIQGWQVDEASPVQHEPQAKPVLPLTSSLLSTPALSLQTKGPLKARKASVPQGTETAKAKASETEKVKGTEFEKGKAQPVRPVLKEESLHETPSQVTRVTLEEESSQHFYNYPTELWSSLSQWIPQHALFQPSLHHQATLELSDTPAQTYPYQIDSSENSRPAQGQHRHARQGQASKPYRPRTSLREIEIPKRPLFV